MPASFTETVKTVEGKQKPKRIQVRAGPKFTTHGRPCKRTPALDKALLKAISAGAPYKIACLACGISEDAFTDWRRKDPAFAQAVEQASGKMALRLLAKIEKQADENFSAAAWMLERRFGESFARPEIQFNMLTQNNVTHDHLTIVISPEEAKELNARGEETREKVRAMFAEYQQRRGNGNGNGAGSKIVEVAAEVVKKPADLAKPADPGPITRQAGDEKSSVFWALFASGTGDRPVVRDTAVFVIRQILSETIGPHRVGKVEFLTETVTVSDILSILENRAPGSAWQLIQKKALVA
jgi:hypothetical protein